MTPKKKAPAKRGRKPSADGRMDQLTVRLPPSLKLGLEYLATHQKRSLSEAMQWAVRVGLNSWSVTRSLTMGDVLEQLSKCDTEAQRVLAAYNIEPSLLGFEDRAAAQLVLESYELAELERRFTQAIVNVGRDPEDAKAKKLEETSFKKAQAWKDNAEMWIERFVVVHWLALKEFAAKLQNSGKPLSDQSLIVAANVPSPRGMDIFDVIERDSKNP